MSSLRSNHLFHRSADGRILRRKEGIWSSCHERCRKCGTTERPHEAHGFCHKCYVSHRYATDEQYRERCKRSTKLRSLRSDYQEQYDARRQGTEKRREQRRIISRRYAEKSAKWPIDCQVLYELVHGIEPIKGTVIAKTNARCHVRFETFNEWIPMARLRRAA